jgi:hypothetical protein
MPANVTFDFARARQKYEEANSPQGKLEALIEMQRYAPKHKGGENLRAEISKKISNTRRDIEKQKLREAKRGSAPSLSVKKEGAGQIVLVGMPNSGKSWLLNKLTGADAEIAPYAFTTKKPEVGMMNYKGARVQVVEVPAIVEGSSKGKAAGTQILSIIRNADAIVVLARNRDEEGIVKRELEAANIRLGETKPDIKIEESKFKGITISGKKFLKVPEAEIINFLKSQGIYNAGIILNDPTDIGTIVRALDGGIAYKKSITVNAFGRIDFEKLRERLFGLLGKVLIYTKKPGSKPDYNGPLVLKKGSTIEDVARHLHKEFAQNLKYAKLWGSSKFPGQMVPRGYQLQNEDVVEIYS